MSRTTISEPLAREVGDAELDQCLKRLNVYGYALIDGLLPPATIERLRGLVDHHFDAERHGEFAGRPEREKDDRLVYNLQNKDKLFIDILDSACLRRVLAAKLNDPFYKHLPPAEPNYILSYYNARSSGPELPVHTDTFLPSPGDKTWTMQVAFMLEDSNRENGCTVLAPGSHRTGEFVDRGLESLTSVEASSGDVAIWDSRIWHGTSANTSGKTRWVLIATFTAWWVKQRSDMTRALPEEIYRELDDRQKVLLGFASIPPLDETERLNFKGGYDQLKPSVKDYYRR